MGEHRRSGKLAVILHADVAGSTELVQQDERLTHERIQDTFHRFSDIIAQYHGRVCELRGDALLAEFDRVSDAVTAGLSFQTGQTEHNAQLNDNIQPIVRVGIAMGEVIIADNTVTGAGVVLAQRVEQLAEPGGVAIQGAAYETIPGRFPYQYADLGEHKVKGFDKPVRVYTARLKSDTAIPEPDHADHKLRNTLIVLVSVVVVASGAALVWLKPWEQNTASVERMAFPLPGKPSIAVLPFSNMSDDPEQEYFVDGMTEDLITDLSKLSGLFVIARNSVFIYKGKAVKVSEVAEELGVRYVLEGSVRRSGERVRINVQLIDATTSGHQWAERYDGSLEDIFGLQDRVTQKIVAALAINLTVEEESARAEIQTKDSMAYDAFLQGWEYYRRDTADDFVQAASYFEKAIELDPGYGRAHAALAAVYWNSASRGWTRVFEIRPGYATELSRQHLHEAMKQPSALAHQVASERAALYKHRPDTALAEAERAITLDSNDPAGHLAMANALLKAGKPGQAMESMHQAMRLDPHFPASYLRRLARVELALGQFQEAATALEQAASRNPDDDWTFVFLAAAYGHLGREDEAKATVDQANAIRARVGRGPLVLQTIHRWRVTDEELILEGLANAGVENEPGEWMSLVTQKLSEYEVDGAEKLDVVKAKALHDGGVPFVDVSRPGNWLTGRIPGAIHLSLGGLFFEELLSEVRLLEIANRNQGIVIYCSNPNCSAAPFACAKALMWGFQNVYYFAGGALEWKAAGFPIQKGEENR